MTIPLIRLGRISKGGPSRCWVCRDRIHSDYIFESSLWVGIFRPEGKFIKIGWGDRKIFLETPSWSDLKIEDFLRAFFGMNASVLRIEFMDEIPGGSISLSVDEIQLKMLMSHVLESTNGIAITKEPWYYQKGSFYESHLNYNCITNCNQWVGSGLRKARLSNRIWFPLTIWI